MSALDALGFLGLAAIVLYAVGRLLMAAWFAAKRRHVANVVNDLLKQGEPNGQQNGH